MGIDKVVRGGLFTLFLSFLVTTVSFADTVVGSGSAAFRSWSAGDLDQDGKPYWDNPSLDGNKKDVGYFLINAPTAHLSGAPGSLPFWGESFNAGSDTGGAADLNVYFQRNEQFSTAVLKLEVAGESNVNEFGWYNISQPSVLHPIFLGPDSAADSDTFSPSADYGFYLKDGKAGTYFTQSSLNSKGDTSHQHFVIFEQSATPGAEVYWIGIEDQAVAMLNGAEGCVGDYNDMLVRIGALSPCHIPEPSAAALALCGTLLMVGLLRRCKSSART